MRRAVVTAGLLLALCACGDDAPVAERDRDDAGGAGRVDESAREHEDDRAPMPGSAGSRATDMPDAQAPPASHAGLDASAPEHHDAGPPPHPVSEYCGDEIRDPVLEECDDGPGGSDDACSSDCRVRAMPVLVPPDDAAEDADAGVEPVLDRSFGTGAHVAASSESGFAVAYHETLRGDEGASVWLQAFDANGGRIGVATEVSLEGAPVAEANPTVAALPDGRYAVAFTDGSSGTPDVQIQLVDPERGPTGNARTAHDAASGFQHDPDLLWIGSELIAAWTDLVDVKVRRFDAQLRPLGEEQALADSPAIESSVSLARFGDGYAAALRANELGLERVRVVAGATSWWTPEDLPGPSGDRPALAALDATRLLLLFTVGSDPLGTGSAGVGRLRFAVLDMAAPGAVQALAFTPLREPFASDATLGQRRPSAARVGDHVYVAWESDGVRAAAESFVARVELDVATETLVQEAELALSGEGAAASASRNARLGASPLFPEGALISLWEAAPAPRAASELMLDFRPSPFVVLGAPAGSQAQ